MADRTVNLVRCELSQRFRHRLLCGCAQAFDIPCSQAAPVKLAAPCPALRLHRLAPAGRAPPGACFTGRFCRIDEISIGSPRRAQGSPMDCGTVAILATVATCERRFKYNASGKRRGGPRRAPTARTVVWDTAAIPKDKPPASACLGQARASLGPLLSDANVICLVGPLMTLRAMQAVECY